jgi:hypothetical protein
MHATVEELWEAVFSEETNTPFHRRGCYTRAMTRRVPLQREKDTLVVILKGLGANTN